MKLEDEQEIMNLKALIEDREEEAFIKFKSILKYKDLYQNKELLTENKGIATHG